MSGAAMKTTRITEKFDFEDFRRLYGDEAIPMFLLKTNGKLTPFAEDSRPTPAPGDLIVSIVSE